VAIAYRTNKAAAQQTLLQLQSNGADCVAVETDITDASRAEQLVRTVARFVLAQCIRTASARFHRLIDCLYMCAGIDYWRLVARNP